MTYDMLGPSALDYLPCRYDASRLVFRGPKRSLDAPFCAFLGGVETYGKFIAKPFPALVEEELEMPCVNFGQANAGVDAYAHDPFVLEAASKADVTVIQVMGAQNMTNRFYSVHPRRNDRFVSASSRLQALYREVDFSEFHFTKHMLSRLIAVCPVRFKSVRHELQTAWLTRMQLMLGRVGKRSILVWFATCPPSDTDELHPTLGDDPLFVTESMITRLESFFCSRVDIVASKRAMNAGTDGMFFNEMEAGIAAEVMGPLAHKEAATGIAKAIRNLR